MYVDCQPDKNASILGFKHADDYKFCIELLSVIPRDAAYRYLIQTLAFEIILTMNPYAHTCDNSGS